MAPQKVSRTQAGQLSDTEPSGQKLSSIMPRVSLAPPTLLLPSLWRILPSLPPTVRDMDVPHLFRRRYILSGYRPVGLRWRCYIHSLFQLHNQTLSVWSHLLAAGCVAGRFLLFTILQGGGILGFRLQGPEGQGFSVDAASMPLVLYIFSAITCLSCSAAAHLLQPHSEQAHHWLHFLDSIGVAVYQYGRALASSLYSADATWMQSVQGQVFLPASALLAWLLCATCCYDKLSLRRPDLLLRKLWRLALTGTVCLLDISPVVLRLSTCSWTSSAAPTLHFLQVVLFLFSVFFFSCPIPECCSPGHFDVLCHAHQLSHVLLSLCTLAQQEALFTDFLWRRPALLRQFGEQRLLLASASFPCLMLCCTVTALAMRRLSNHRKARS